MRKYFYIIGIFLVLLIAISLIISQVLLSSRIKKEIIGWCEKRGIESSDFKCGVNLLTRNITLEGLTLNREDNNFLIEKATVSFGLLDLLSKKIIRLIHIEQAEITLKHFSPPFFSLLTTNNSDNPPNSPKNSFLIDELRIENLILKIELPDGNNPQDINLEGLVTNIGANRNTTFSVKARANSSSLEITGDFDFDDWKKRLTYQVLGEHVSLGVINILEEALLPSEVREQLLSLYFKDILMVNLKGKVDITGKGEIKDQNIDSQLKFLVSDLSCETENERIKSLVEKIGKKGFLEIDYKIYGTTTNPYLTYDILF